MKTFAAKVKEERENRGWSQTDLAERIGLTIRSVSSYETGDTKPRGIMLRRLSAVFGVSSDYLMNDEIDDPSYGRDKSLFVEQARVRFGGDAAKEADRLMGQNISLFAGGELSQEAKDAFFEAIMTAYVTCKEEARKKFNPKASKE